MGALFSAPTHDGGHAPGAACDCDLALVIFSSKQLEQVLELHFQAEGKGLHEKITSAQDLPEILKRKLRRVATIRNKLIRDFNGAKAELATLVESRNRATTTTAAAGSNENQGCVIV